MDEQRQWTNGDVLTGMVIGLICGLMLSLATVTDRAFTPRSPSVPYAVDAEYLELMWRIEELQRDIDQRDIKRIPAAAGDLFAEILD